MAIDKFDIHGDLSDEIDFIDNYSHTDPSVFYTTQNIPGPGIDWELFYSQISHNCQCDVDSHDDMLDKSFQNCPNRESTSNTSFPTCPSESAQKRANIERPNNENVMNELSLDKEVIEDLCNQNCTCNPTQHYTKNRLNFDTYKLPIYECNSLCKCSKSCQPSRQEKRKGNCCNRIVQGGPNQALAVFKHESSSKGFGVKSTRFISRGEFICEYAGEVIGKCESKRRYDLYKQEHKQRPNENSNFYIFHLSEIAKDNRNRGELKLACGVKQTLELPNEPKNSLKILNEKPDYTERVTEKELNPTNCITDTFTTMDTSKLQHTDVINKPHKETSKSIANEVNVKSKLELELLDEFAGNHKAHVQFPSSELATIRPCEDLTRNSQSVMRGSEVATSRPDYQVKLVETSRGSSDIRDCDNSDSASSSSSSMSSNFNITKTSSSSNITENSNYIECSSSTLSSNTNEITKISSNRNTTSSDTSLKLTLPLTKSSTKDVNITKNIRNEMTFFENAMEDDNENGHAISESNTPTKVIDSITPRKLSLPLSSKPLAPLTSDRAFEMFIDATRFGNIGRYINHSCDPNCTLLPVRVNSVYPSLAIFARRGIEEGEEVTYDYAGLESETELEDCRTEEDKSGIEEFDVGTEEDQNLARNIMTSSERDKCVDQELKKCFCGQKKCRKFLPYLPLE